MSLNTKLIAQVIADFTNPLDLTTPRDSLNLDKRLRLSSGTGADQADLLWHDQRTVLAAANDDLDLAGGGLLDAFGNIVTFAAVKGLVISSASANGDTLTVGAEGTNPFDTWVADATDAVVIRPGGLLALFAPDATAYVVTAATADILRVTNNDAGGPATYDIAVVGVAA